MLKPFSIVAVLLAVLPADPARAQHPGAGRPEALRDFVTAKAGEAVRVWTFFDCEDPRGAPTGFGSAANGLIAVKRVTELQCGNPEQPVAQLFYTPREGFSGEDDAVLRGPRGQEVQIKLWVNPSVDVASAVPPAAAAAASPEKVEGAVRQPTAKKPAAPPQRTSARTPRKAAAAKARSCSRRGDTAIVRLWRCEFVASLKTAGRKRVVRRDAESAR
jgi:hypothetical protein